VFMGVEELLTAERMEGQGIGRKLAWDRTSPSGHRDISGDRSAAGEDNESEEMTLAQMSSIGWG